MRSEDGNNGDGQASEATAPTLDPALEAQLAELFPIHQGDSFEVISGSTGAESITGGLTAGAMSLWRREHVGLDEAYRMAAERNDRGETPTQGGGAGSDPASLHWGLLLAPWDYQNREGRSTGPALPGIEPAPGARSGNLPATQQMLREGSPLMRAAASSYGRHIAVENPTAQGMVGAIIDASLEMALALPDGATGQLSVNFQGHGARGNIQGVDGPSVNRQTLRRLANDARQDGVHITYILDTCNAGSLALLAENDELFNVVQESAGTLTPEQAAERAARGRPLMSLFRLGLDLNDLATDLAYAIPRNSRDDSRAREVIDSLLVMLEQFRTVAGANPEIEDLGFLSVRSFGPTITLRVLQDRATIPRAVAKNSRVVLAPFLDDLNALLSREVATIRSLTPDTPAQR